MRNVADRFVDRIKTHILYSVNFFSRKSCRLWDNVEKYRRDGYVTDDDITHGHCMLFTEIWKYTLRIYLLVFHCNNGYRKAPQYYVIRTLSCYWRIYVENICKEMKTEGFGFGMVSGKGFIHYCVFLLDILYCLRHNFETLDLSESRPTNFFVWLYFSKLPWHMLWNPLSLNV